MTGNPWFGWAPYHLKQNINPMDIFWNPSGQYGLLNITMKSSDPAAERDIVENVASYGKQLGRVCDVLLVVLDRMADQSLDDGERKAIAAFRAMTSRITLLKETHSLPNEDNLTKIVEAIACLKWQDPPAHQRIKDRLRHVLDT